MSWFGEGLSNLKGQITNFTKEVLAEAAAENSDLTPDQLQLEDAKKQLSELQTACNAKDIEISRLQQRAQELEARLKLPQHSASSPNVLQPHLSAAALAGPSSAGSAVEEEQDGWSQFSEEDFPCLNETGDFTAAATASTPTAVVNKDDDRAVLRAKLQDAEARLHELELRPAEEQQSSVSELQLSCQQLLKQIVSFDEKGEGDTEARTLALEQLVSLLQGRPEDVASRTKLEEECGRLRRKLEQSEKKADSLKSQVENVKEENLTLTKSLEELDDQNQAALERLMALKTSLTAEKEQLTGQLAAAHTEAQQELENRLSQLEDELRTSLSQSLPESIAQEVGDADSVAVLGRAVARQCADLLWKKEASERKLAEVTREVRELRQELTTARSEAAKLREHSERLMGQLSVAVPSTSGALEPIPEDREEDGEVTFEDVTETPEAPSHSNQSVESLQREAEALREARENLEAEVTSLRTTNEGLATRMRSMGAELRNQENLQREATSFSVQVSGLKQQLQDAVGHNETLGQELLSTQRQMRELQEKFDVLVKQEEELKLGKDSMVEILRDKEMAEQALQEEVEKLKQELQQQILNNNNSQILLSSLQQQVKELQECSSDVTSLQQNLQTLEVTSSKFQSENESLKHELEQQVLNNNNSQILLSSLQQQVKELQEGSSIVTNLEQKLQTLELNSSEIQSENESLKQECSTLKQQIKEKTTENSSLFYQLQEAFMNMECMQRESTIEGQSIQKYVEKVKMLVQSNSDLQLECQKLQEQLKSVEMDVELKSKEVVEKIKLGTECSRLQLEVENALAEKLQLQEILAQQSSQINELQSRLESESKTYEGLIEHEKNSYKELAAKFSDMEKSYRDVVNVAESLQQETQKLKAETELVMNKTEDDDSLIRRLECEISEWRNKAVNIEESYQMSSQGYQEIVKAMEAKEKVASKLETDMENLNQEVENLTESLNLKCIECSTLEDNIALLEQQQQKLTVINSKLSAELEEKNKEHSELKTSLIAAENQKSELSTQLHNLNILLTEEKQRLESEIVKSQRLSEDFEKIQNAKESIVADNQQLKEELQSSLQKLASFESTRLNATTTDSDNAALKNLQAEFDVVQKQSQSLEEQCALLKQQISDSEMIKHQLSVVQVERANILGVLDEKTRENASLRSENHRLMALVATEKATSQQLLQEKTELLSRKEFQSSEASEMARESVASLAKIIRDKDQELETLKSKNQSLLTLMQDSNPGLAIHQLFSQHPDVELLKKEVGQLQQEKSQLVQSLQLKHQESLQYHAEIQRLTMALTERPMIMEPSGGGNANIEQLMQSLSQEQQRNKFLQNEVQELSEKESALQGELGRLRQHLVSVEEQYTEEALRGEQMTQELRSQLAAAEERARNTVTSLSSASARAGQQVELLQEQARVASAQRDDALRRLTIAEDEVRHHAAGLRNLQSVLEQFQQDKDREVELACERLKQQLRVANQRSDQLVSDIRTLQGQLQEAKEGLSAAARLGVQMDKKSEQIASLKEEVAKLNEQLNQAQQQINSASQSMEGKVDKYLIKNLIVGYFMTAPNNRQEALRIVATVLDFSREERARVGLDSSPGRGGTPAKGGSQAQSLAEAFIRFLENESRPVPQVRMLEEAMGRQRKASPAPARSPLLMDDMVLPSFAPVPTIPSASSPASSSSSLKDVLRDS